MNMKNNDLQIRQIADDVVRADLQRSLKQSHLKLSQFSCFQRVLLTTDGTVTEILEAYLMEKIKVTKLSEIVKPLSAGIMPLEVSAGSEVIRREILLQGSKTEKTWIYAESALLPERLEVDFRTKLLTTKIPIGKLWLEYKVETFKQIISSIRHPAKELAQHFDIEADDWLLSRTYVVFCKGVPVMMITEKFPEKYFL